LQLLLPDQVAPPGSRFRRNARPVQNPLRAQQRRHGRLLPRQRPPSAPRSRHQSLRERFSDRFEREARAIAAQNYQNVSTPFDIGPNYLVMELIEDETLSLRRRSGSSNNHPTLFQ
jgi:tRNA A-37 threonylcarbamoyl transferase component Bud32